MPNILPEPDEQETIDGIEEPETVDVPDLDALNPETVKPQPRITDRAPSPPSAPSADASALPEVDGYTIKGKLGEGGMGVVWRAHQLSTGRDVALKLLPPHSLGSEKAQQRFDREVKTAASLEHPHIAGVYDSGLHRGVFFYAMQVIEEADEFNRYVKEAGLDAKAIIQLTIKIAKAVDFAHDKGIVHRDLKPGNVVVDKAGEPHILDFGLAKGIEGQDAQLSMQGELVGTPMYMSTEQARGEVLTLDGRTDIYALGVMLYEVLVGAFPYESGGGAYEIIRRKLEQDPQRPRMLNEKLDLDIEAVLLKAIAPRREERYESAGAFAQELRNYLRGRPVTARKQTPGYLACKWFKRNRIRLLVVLILASAFAGTYEAMRRKGVRETEAAQQAARSILTGKITDLDESLATNDVERAGLHLDELDELSEDPAIQEVISEYTHRINALRERHRALAEVKSARDKRVSKLADMVNRILEGELHTPEDLNEQLLEQLSSIDRLFPDRTLRNPREVASKLDALDGVITLFAGQIIDDQTDLHQRQARLDHVAEFLGDSRLQALLPDFSETVRRHAEQQKLHLVEFDNNLEREIEVRDLGGDMGFSVQPHETELVSLPADGANSEFVVELSDPLFLPRSFEVLAEQGGGDVIEINAVDDFARKKVTLVYEAPVADMNVSAARDPEGPWGVATNGMKVLPGIHYLKFERQDYEPVVSRIEVTMGQDPWPLATPSDEDWKEKPYVTAFTTAERLYREGHLEDAQTTIRTVDVSQVESESLRSRIETLAQTINTDPLLRLNRTLPAAEREVLSFVKSLIQIYDPLAVGRTALRYLSGDGHEPSITFVEFDAAAIQRLSQENVARYFLLRAWTDAVRQTPKGSFDLLKQAGGDQLESFIEQHGSLDRGRDLEARAQLAILKQPSKVRAPGKKELAIEHYLIAQWQAHALYRRGDLLRANECLQAMARASDLGGIMDRRDLAVAGYAAYFIFENVVESLRQSGVTVGHTGSSQEQQQAANAYHLLLQAAKGMDAQDFSQAFHAFSLNAAQKKSLANSDMMLSFAFSKADALPELKSLARKRYEAISAQRKQQLPSSEWEQLKQEMLTLSVCLGSTE